MTPMTLEELQQFVAQYGVSAVDRKERAIKSRHYNVVIRKNDEIIETVEYLTMRQAREYRDEYHAEGYSVDIIEDVTILANGQELEIPDHRPEIPVVKGIGGFGTPAATKSKINNDRLKAANKNNRGKANPGFGVRITGSYYRDPSSSLYPAYMDNFRRKGFQVINKNDNTIVFEGLMKEVREWLMSKKDLTVDQIKRNFEIKYIGTEK